MDTITNTCLPLKRVATIKVHPDEIYNACWQLQSDASYLHVYERVPVVLNLENNKVECRPDYAEELLSDLTDCLHPTLLLICFYVPLSDEDVDYAYYDYIQAGATFWPSLGRHKKDLRVTMIDTNIDTSCRSVKNSARFKLG